MPCLLIGCGDIGEKSSDFSTADEIDTSISEASTAHKPAPSETTHPITPGAMPLTVDEIERMKEIFQPTYFDENGTIRVNPYNLFVAVYYDRPENIDLSAFLEYSLLGEEITDEVELKAVEKLEIGMFGAVIPAPIHKYPAKAINETLMKYTGITLDELNEVEQACTLCYLEEYDAYYNFTSDFAAAQFICKSGERQGNLFHLYGEWDTLTLREVDEEYWFVAHQLAG